MACHTQLVLKAWPSAAGAGEEASAPRPLQRSPWACREGRLVEHAQFWCRQVLHTRPLSDAGRGVEPRSYSAEGSGGLRLTAHKEMASPSFCGEDRALVGIILCHCGSLRSSALPWVPATPSHLTLSSGGDAGPGPRVHWAQPVSRELTLQPPLRAQSLLRVKSCLLPRGGPRSGRALLFPALSRGSEMDTAVPKGRHSGACPSSPGLARPPVSAAGTCL